MFTGIITDIGRVISYNRTDEGCNLVIGTHYDMTHTDKGASIACNGVCLTVVDKGNDDNGDWFLVQASHETIDVTTLKNWQEGTLINLEKALCLGDELGGHIVQGHVDGVGSLISSVPDGNSRRLTFKAPERLLPFIAQKGSITVEGVSLTVNSVDKHNFSVAIIPHTAEKTTLGKLGMQQQVNLEIDVIARYLFRFQEMAV